MGKIPQSLLLARENVPHFIFYATRFRVLTSYRYLHRNLNRIDDALARDHLKTLAQHGFARFKFISGATKVNALLDYAELHEFLWARGAAMGDHKDLFRCLEYAFSTYKVKKPAIEQILLSRNPVSSLFDRGSLAYRLNNIQTPGIRDFKAYQDHEAAMKSMTFASMPPYWQLVRILRANRVIHGNHKRKVVSSLQDLGTPQLNVLGQPVAKSRQANVLKKLYAQFLRDAPRPVHPEVLQHVAAQLRNTTLKRVYARRYKDLSLQLYTVDESGNMRRCSVH